MSGILSLSRCLTRHFITQRPEHCSLGQRRGRRGGGEAGSAGPTHNAPGGTTPRAPGRASWALAPQVRRAHPGRGRTGRAQAGGGPPPFPPSPLLPTARLFPPAGRAPCAEPPATGGAAGDCARLRPGLPAADPGSYFILHTWGHKTRQRNSESALLRQA